ncbi:MAG: effector-associated domain EAD1-containing protein [Candidatus Promineifilaceae bacterium]
MNWIGLRRELATAINNGFSQDDLARALRYELNRDIEQLAPANSSRVKVVEAILNDAERKGWVEDLLAGLKSYNPKNVPVAVISSKILAEIEHEGKAFYQASLKHFGDEASAAPTHSTSVGTRGVNVSGHVGGNIVTGDNYVGGDSMRTNNIHGSNGIAIGNDASAEVSQSTTNYSSGAAIDGDDPVTVNQATTARQIDKLFASVLLSVIQHAPPEQMVGVVQQVEQLKTEVKQGKNADDPQMATLIGRIGNISPNAIGVLLNTFAIPLLANSAGIVTQATLAALRIAHDES